MQTCSSPRHCFSEASASSNASIREPQGAASPELGDSPWHHSTLLLNFADSAYFFIFYFYFFSSCLSTGLLLSSVGSWMSRTSRFGPVRWTGVVPQENRLRHACLALWPSCSAPASSAPHVQSQQVCGKIACLLWAEHQHSCHRTQKAGHFSPLRALHEAALHSSLPPDPLALGKIKLWIGCLQGMAKEIRKWNAELFFSWQYWILSFSCKHRAVIISQTAIQAGSAESIENARYSRALTASIYNGWTGGGHTEHYLHDNDIHKKWQHAPRDPLEGDSQLLL